MQAVRVGAGAGLDRTAVQDRATGRQPQPLVGELAQGVLLLGELGAQAAQGLVALGARGLARVTLLRSDRRGRCRPLGRPCRRGLDGGSDLGLTTPTLTTGAQALAGAELVLVQEEPENQGAWPFLGMNLPADLAKHGETRGLTAVTRPPSASPAAGTAKKHAQEQADLIARAFDR